MRVPKCQVCKAEYVKRQPGQKVCSPRCALSLVALNRKSKERKETRIAKINLKSRTDWIKDAQTAVNAYIRARDENKYCISCGTHLVKVGRPGGDYDAGHYRSRGNAPHLRFDERNIHGQCKKCNRYASGAAAEYRLGLIERIGLAAVEELEADQEPRKWSVDELKDIVKQYKEKLKQLKHEREQRGN